MGHSRSEALILLGPTPLEAKSAGLAVRVRDAILYMVVMKQFD